MGSVLTLYQQIVAGDSWGYLSIPNIEKSPVAAILLPLVHLVIGLGIMNLILAVIVDRAVEAREAKKDEALKKKLKDQHDRKLYLVHMFEDLDADQNGTLDFEEVNEAFSSHPEFRMMMMQQGIKSEDLWDVFTYLDKDDSGSVTYLEFCDVLDDIASRDVRVLSALCKINIGKVEHDIHKMSEEFRDSFRKIDEKLEKLLAVRPGLQRKHDVGKARYHSEGPDAASSPVVAPRAIPHFAPIPEATFKTLPHPAQTQEGGIGASKLANFVSNGAMDDTMSDIERCLADLKCDIRRLLREQDADHRWQLHTLLSSVLPPLGAHSQALTSLKPGCHQVNRPFPAHGILTPPSGASEAVGTPRLPPERLPSIVGLDFPAVAPSPRI